MKRPVKHDTTLSTCNVEHERTVRQAHDLLVENLQKRITIADLAKKFHLNASTLKQAFKRGYGKLIATYRKEYRVREGMPLLQTTDLRIYDIALRVGYHSQSRFSEAFQSVAHCLPAKYRKSP